MCDASTINIATHLVWFRNDLRIKDNSALHYACQNPDAQVIAVYIATPEQWKQHNMSPRQAWFIKQHIHELQDSLNKLNIPLLFHEVNDFTAQQEYIVALCRQYLVTDLFYNKQYEWNERQRDYAIEHQLTSLAINVQHFDDSVLFSPGSVLNGEGEMYKVYTPFRNKCTAYLQDKTMIVYPEPNIRNQSLELKSLTIQPFRYPCQETRAFSIGEEAAQLRLQQFCEEQVVNYLHQRDIPELDSTSKLSPYLAIGVLSVRQCIACLRMEFPGFIYQVESGAFTWFNEIIWREFYRHLLFMYPRLSKNKAFIPWTDTIHWNYDQKLLSCWQEGQTGYPMIDAAMRQLNHTGWMHNRLRMIVASFLVKDLLIDWRQGEQYFMSQLIDGDLAANNGGWQWAASTGVDSTPYFRIFNPTTQGKRFDPSGRFIRQYLPELASVPDSAIHEPHKWAKKNKVNLEYPEPIVDHKQSRLAAISAFERAR